MIVESSVRVLEPAERVFGFLKDLRHWPEGTLAGGADPTLREGAAFVTSGFGPFPSSAEIHTVTALVDGERLSYRTSAGGSSSVTTWSLASEEGGTRVTLRWEPAPSRFDGVLGPLLEGVRRRVLAARLRRLRDLVESSFLSDEELARLGDPPRAVSAAAGPAAFVGPPSRSLPWLGFGAAIALAASVGFRCLPLPPEPADGLARAEAMVLEGECAQDRPGAEKRARWPGRYVYRFDAGGRTATGVSFGPRPCLFPGQTAAVEYSTEDPRRSRLVGMRSAPLPGWALAAAALLLALGAAALAAAVRGWGERRRGWAELRSEGLARDRAVALLRDLAWLDDRGRLRPRKTAWPAFAAALVLASAGLADGLGTLARYAPPPPGRAPVAPPVQGVPPERLCLPRSVFPAGVAELLPLVPARSGLGLAPSPWSDAPCELYGPGCRTFPRPSLGGAWQGQGGAWAESAHGVVFPCELPSDADAPEGEKIAGILAGQTIGADTEGFDVLERLAGSWCGSGWLAGAEATAALTFAREGGRVLIRGRALRAGKPESLVLVPVSVSNWQRQLPGGAVEDRGHRVELEAAAGRGSGWSLWVERQGPPHELSDRGPVASVFKLEPCSSK